MRSSHSLFAAVSVLAACSGPAEDTWLDVVYDPCNLLAVVADSGTLPPELASVEAALGMWNEIAGTRLTTDHASDVAHVVVRFEEAAPVFHGVYDDELGVVIVNRLLADSHERAVTVAHELGHAFGLWHVSASDRTSVMNHGNLEIEPNAADADAIHELWGDCDAR